MKNIIFIALAITIASFNLTAFADPTPGYSQEGPSKGTCRIIGRDVPCKRKFE